jgi:hypothetical protein
MIKIAQQMNQAIRSERDFRLGNTTVLNTNNGTEVYLHGNKIAEIGDDYIILFDGGYQTATTKSRLNDILRQHGRLGDCILQKKGVWYFRDGKSKEEIPFMSGLYLS